MHRMSQTNNKNCGQFKRKLAALSLLLCLVIASLLATVFIIAQADHDCAGEDCSVCALIHNAQNLLNRIGKATVAILVATMGLFTAITIWSKLDFLFKPYHSNLVNVKTRLNN